MFGNPARWVRRALGEACKKVEGTGLEVAVVGKK